MSEDICDVSIDPIQKYSCPDAPVVIRYRASKNNSRGLSFVKPCIYLRIEQGGRHSCWIDAETIVNALNNHRESIEKRLDEKFIPTIEWGDLGHE